MWIILNGGLELDSTVLEERDYNTKECGYYGGGDRLDPIKSIPTAMRVGLIGLEMETVMEEITIPKSVDMMEVTGAAPRRPRPSYY